ncbi:MAG TPA: MBL fold metallo-hydrolase [Gammaproteobacteria bacterium]|nr:MBL fold metallo-hydrolase [Gammaproteobacteria bacterium]
MRSRYVFAVVLVLAASTAMGQGRGGRGGGSPFGNFELAIEQVRDGIYMIRSSASGNITVFTSDDGVLFVDNKFENEYDRYMELLRTVTDQPVRYVINTHMHPDHTGGNARLEALDAAIIATENARRRLAETQSGGLPIFTFDDHLRVYFGGRPMDLYWLGRGHTDGDLVIHLPEDGMILTGDLFAGGDPYVRAIDPAGGGSLKEWSATVERVLELDFDTVIPGHSGVTDRATLEDFQDETIRIHELITEMLRTGRSIEDIQTALGTEFDRMAFFVFGSAADVIAEFE